MIQKYIDEAKEVIATVKATEENYTFEESREEDINFYSESFWLLVVLMEQTLRIPHGLIQPNIQRLPKTWVNS